MSHSPERFPIPTRGDRLRERRRHEWSKNRRDETHQPLQGGELGRIELSKIGGPKGPQDSGPELFENLREQRLVRIAAGHANPHFANGDLNQRSDFE